MSELLHASTNHNSAQQGSAARLAAAQILEAVLDDHASLDDLTNSVGAPSLYRKLDARDQALAKAITLTALRNHRRIQSILSRIWSRKPPQKARFLLHMIEIAATQILFMQVPESAAVNLAVNSIGNDKRTARFRGFANGVLRSLCRGKDDLLQASKNEPAFAPWMQKALVTDYGKDKTAQIGEAILNQPYLDITLKQVDVETAISMPAIQLPGISMRLESEAAIDSLPGFSDGNWWVQDISAAQPARLLGDIRGKSIADLCAAPGGKTMQLSAGGAQVTAVDISAKRMERLQENISRCKLTAELVVSDILDWKPGKVFDAILLDAPCSATGTMRRHPDILWNKSTEQVTSLIELQRRLINKAAELLVPGGLLIYANCSLLKSEGEDLVHQLINTSATNSEKSDAGAIGRRLEILPILAEELPGLEFCINRQGTFRSLPHYLEIAVPNVEPAIQGQKNGMDGFFVARFKVH